MLIFIRHFKLFNNDCYIISIFSVHDYVHELTELTLAPDNGEGQAAAMNFGGNKNR